MDLIQTLKAAGVRAVALALDQDYPGQAAARELLYQLAEADFRVAYVDWPAEHKGPDDAITAGAEPRLVTGDEVVLLLDRKIAAMSASVKTSPPPPASTKQRTFLRSLSELVATDYPEPSWVVPNLIPSGLTILCSKPKVGKSMLMLDIAIAVANGADVLDESTFCEQGRVLYLDMEGVPRNSKKRAINLIGDRKLELDGVVVVNADSDVPRWPAFMEWLEVKYQEAGKPKVVIIDVWARVKPGSDQKKNDYDSEYEALIRLKRFSEEKDCAVILIHHLRKNLEVVEDLYDGVLGSTALTGAVDTMALLHRKREDHNGYLMVTGREVEHTKVHLTFDQRLHRWRAVPPPEGGSVSFDRWVRDYLAEGDPMPTKELTQAAVAAGFTEAQAKNYKAPDIRKFQTGSGKTKVWFWQITLPKAVRLEKLQSEHQRLSEERDRAIDREDYETAGQVKARLLEIEGKIDAVTKEP